MSVDEIRRMPETLGLLAYRNRRGVLLDLAGWDERRDADDIQHGKRITEDEQRTVFTIAYPPRTPQPQVPDTAPAADSTEAVSEE